MILNSLTHDQLLQLLQVSACAVTASCAVYPAQCELRAGCVRTQQGASLTSGHMQAHKPAVELDIDDIEGKAF